MATPPSPSTAPSPLPSTAPRRRLVTWTLRGLAALGLVVVFAVSLVAAALIHLGLPPGRRAIATLVSQLASKQLRGKIEVDTLGSFGLHGLEIPRITLRDPAGNLVLEIDDLAVAIRPAALLRAHTLDHVSAKRIDATLLEDAGGQLTLLDAVQLRNPSPPSTKPSGPPPKMGISAIDVDALGIHGSLEGRVLDAKLAIHRAGVSLGPDGTKVSLPELDALLSGPTAGLPTPVNIVVSVDATEPDGDSSKPVVPRLNVDVTSGTSKVHLDGHFVDNVIEANATASVTPDDLVQWTGQDRARIQPVGTLQLVTHADGPLGDVGVDGTLATAVGGAHWSARLDALALIAAPSPTTQRLVTVDVGLDAVEPHRIEAVAPEGHFDLKTHVEVDGDAGGKKIAASGALSARDEVVAGWFRTATVGFSGNVVLGAGDTPGVREGSARIGLVRGASHLSIDAHAQTRGAQCCFITGSIEGAVTSLEELPPGLSAGGISGSVSIAAEGDFDTVHQELHVSATVDSPNLRRDTVRVVGAHIRANGSGVLPTPTMHAEVRIDEASLLEAKTSKPSATFRAIAVDLDAHGDELTVDARLDTDHAQHLAAKSKIERIPKRGVIVHDTTVQMSRDKFLAVLSARRVTVGGPTIQLDGVRLASTAGGARVDGTLTVAGIPEALDVATTDLDVGQLAFAAGVDDIPFRGTVRLNGKVGRNVGASPLFLGTIDLVVKGNARIAARPQKWVPVALDTKFGLEREKASVTGALDVGTIIHLKIDAETDAHQDDLASWSREPGHVDISASGIDLPRVLHYARTFAPPSQPIAPGIAIAGTAAIDLHLARTARGAPPTLKADLEGSKVSVRTSTYGVEPLDFGVHLGVQPPPGKSGFQVDLAADLTAPGGKLVDLTATTTLTQAITAAVQAGTATATDFQGVPLTVKVSVPKQPITKLPAFIRERLPLSGTTPYAKRSSHGKSGGTVAVTFDASGTLAAPKVTLDGELDGLHVADAGPYGLSLKAGYDGAALGIHATVGNAGGDQSLTVDSEVKLAIADALASHGAFATVPWTASMNANAQAVPLELFTAVADAGITGRLEGEAHIAHVHDRAAGAPTGEIDMRIRPVTSGDVAFATLHVTGAIGADAAHAEINLEGAGAGALVTAKAPLAWTDAMIPRVRAGGTLDLVAHAKALRLLAIAPFVAALDELDGRLDTDATVSITPPAQPTGAWSILPKGTVTLHDGVVNVAAIGERWERIEAAMSLTSTKIDLSKLVLHGRGGEGVAEMSGTVDLDSLHPTTLNAKLHTNRFAIATGGVEIGELSGNVKITGRLDGELPKVKVVIDPMVVDLAQASNKTPQNLDENPTIYEEQPIAAPIPPPTPSTFAMEIAIDIPDNMWIRRDDILVALRGGPTITIGPHPSYRGEIRSDRGRVTVMGKQFTIVQAVITFTGAAELDPALDIQATWVAPEDTVVTFGIGGHLSAPKVTLSANPTASDAQIMNLLVLGRREAGSASSQQSSSDDAGAETAAIAGAMTAAVLGGQLQRILPANASLTLTPGADGLADAKIEAGYQWKHIYFEVGYNAGTTTPAPGALSQPTTTVGIEWRLLKHWSLMTTLGDTGSSLVDFVWHFRY